MKLIKIVILIAILALCSGCKKEDRGAAIHNVIDNCPGEVTLTVSVSTFGDSIEAKCVGWNIDQAIGDIK